jgi:hypothetical protein
VNQTVWCTRGECTRCTRVSTTLTSQNGRLLHCGRSTHIRCVYVVHTRFCNNSHQHKITYASLCTHTQIHKHQHTQTQTHAQTHTQRHRHTHTHTHTHTYIYTYTHTNANAHTNAHAHQHLHTLALSNLCLVSQTVKYISST